MKQYTYVNIRVSGVLFGGETLEHREVIDEYAARGFRYVGYLPTKLDSYGKIREIDLIFEQDI